MQKQLFSCLLVLVAFMAQAQKPSKHHQAGSPKTMLREAPPGAVRHRGGSHGIERDLGAGLDELTRGVGEQQFVAVGQVISAGTERGGDDGAHAAEAVEVEHQAADARQGRPR